MNPAIQEAKAHDQGYKLSQGHFGQFSEILSPNKSKKVSGGILV